MERADFQKLALDWIADAKALLTLKRWAAAYYLAGYAVECALKSCILARVEGTPGIIFEERRYSEKCWTHNLIHLWELTNLKGDFEADWAANPDLNANWEMVRDWSESSRYLPRPRANAEELLEAITNKKHEVLSWIKQRW